MAGITNAPFRRICRKYGAGLFVSEMITARPLVEGNAKTLKLAAFDPDESPRSLQLYGVDPHYVGEAVSRLVGQSGVDHIDMNFGCPVPKVTRRGGGSALPLRRRLLQKILAAAVRHAQGVPITIKFRIGIDDNLTTFLETGKIAQEEGCAAVALHARTAAQFYEGAARWEAIAQLKDHVTHIPVLGNGDIWEAHDAARMIASTRCDGVVIGRGCLGRPWLFAELAALFAGTQAPDHPNFGQVAEVMMDHARSLIAWFGSEAAAMANFRKHAAWYTKGFRHSNAMRTALMTIRSIEDLRSILDAADASEAFPQAALRAVRGKSGRAQRVALPENYLAHLDDDEPLADDQDDDAQDGG
jgi:nifR3 family TIM-barrel protein